MKRSYFCCMLSILFCTANYLYALDTDIYQADVKQNAYILLDNSGSMDYGVYESHVDYGAMYDDLYQREGIGDTIVSGDGWFGNHYEKTKIYLVKGKIRAKRITVGGETSFFTGDAADPDYLWYSNNMVDTHTYIDAAGNLSGETGENAQTQRLTTNADGYILFDGQALPAGQSILLKEHRALFDGSIINEGFGGLLNAPGYYFSGYEGVGSGSLDVVEDGDEYIYFFITGNWMNMQQMYNLHYTEDPPGSPKSGDPAWKYEEFSLDSQSWAITPYSLDYPSGNTKYTKNHPETDDIATISHVGAEYIQIYFDDFDVKGDGNTGTFNNDYVALYDIQGNLIAKYDNDNSPEGAWSPTIEGNTVKIALKSNSDKETGKGYKIDKYRTTYLSSGAATGSYKMQTRLDVAKDAMLYVIDAFRGKINWGIASFGYQGTSGNGASIGPYLNPTVNDDTNRAAIETQLNVTTPKYGTPLGEALQDMFEEGFYKKKSSLDNLLCRKNYVIVVSDGYPSDDEDWNRISGVSFDDWDEDGFTSDPYQSSNPSPNYYDDVAHWIYTHSWLDKSEVSDPANSYVNVIPHQIAFGAKQPLMRNAAEEAGAEYITAYNKEQLVNAFYSIGLMISQAVSFTSPAVSVSAENKIENGDDIYLGLFLPRDNEPWPGNVKHFQFGDGSLERPEKWGIYDAANHLATDSAGNYLDNTNGYWGDDSDPNDSNNYGQAEIDEDGVGEVLTETVRANYTNGVYYDRNIKTWVDDGNPDTNNLIAFKRDTMSPTLFGLNNTETILRDKIVNWVYGYSFDADVTTGNPLAPRSWALGAIIHSSPTIIDYYDSNNTAALAKRYIAVGADDGMLHVFNDFDGNGPDGKEIFAFIPDDVLTKLSAYETSVHVPLVDGHVRLIQQNGQPKYLIFGLRRGGSSYWRINIADSNPDNWTVSKISDSELGQSWSAINTAKIQTGTNTFKDVIIFSGGYDPEEDNYPEPFDDLDGNGTPFASNGNLDTKEWKANSSQDINSNGSYDIYNPAANETGKGIYILDLETLAPVFTIKNGSQNNPSAPGSFSNETSQTRTDMIYCFPATPSVAVKSSYIQGSRIDNLLAAIYAPDIYGNLFRIIYDYNDGSPQWQVKNIFSAYPGSDNASGTLGGNNITTDRGRKVFYGPAISWKGVGRYLDHTNYYYATTDFSGTDLIAGLYFGTGDREHPTYQIVQDRIYAVYDDSSVAAVSSGSDIAVSSAPYNESDLLNLTCDELGQNTTLASGDTYAYKSNLKTLLLDDPTNPDSTAPMELASGGNGENDAKGWYIILEKQGDSNFCSHCSYEAIVDAEEGGRDDHSGEKVLSKILLLDGICFFTTYKPTIDDPCAPSGNGFFYAIDYEDAYARLNLNGQNDDPTDPDEPIKKDVTDRYGVFENIKVISSSPEFIVRDGEIKAITNLGLQETGIKSVTRLNYWIER